MLCYACFWHEIILIRSHKLIRNKCHQIIQIDITKVNLRLTLQKNPGAIHLYSKKLYEMMNKILCELLSCCKTPYSHSKRLSFYLNFCMKLAKTFKLSLKILSLTGKQSDHNNLFCIIIYL